MPGQYDFNPRVSPMQGLSLQDLVNSKRSTLSTLAGSTPPILEALQRRAALQRQQNEQQMFLQGLSNPAMATGAASLSPEQLMAGLRSGVLDPRGALELSPITQEKRRAEIDKLKAEAEFKRKMALGATDANGNAYALIEDPMTGKLTVQMLPGVKGPKGGGPAAKSTRQLTPKEKLLSTVSGAEELAADAAAKQPATTEGPGILDWVGNKLFGNKNNQQAIPISYELNGQMKTQLVPSANVPAAIDRLKKGGAKNIKTGS